MIRLAVTLILYASLLLPANASVTITLSDEAFGNNTTGRTAAATLDDDWESTQRYGTFSPDLFSNGNGQSGSHAFIDKGGHAYRVNWQVGYINDSSAGTSTVTQFIPVHSGNVSYSRSRTLQGSAPNPFPNEARLSTTFPAPGLNAVQLDFSHSNTPITEFGIFIGDTESRPHNGTVARILVYDLAGSLLHDYPIIYTVTVLNNVPYTTIEPIGLPSGSANNDKGDWGNDTTAFVSIKSDTTLGKVIFHTGDDDHTSSNNGTSEQIGLVGFQLPDAPAALTLTKTVQNLTTGSAETTTQNTAVPGDTLQYRITYTNGATTALTDVNISDPLPAFTQLIAGSIRCETTPPNLNCSPINGQQTDIKWLFSGTLLPGEQGSVTYQVTLE